MILIHNDFFKAIFLDSPKQRISWRTTSRLFLKISHLVSLVNAEQESEIESQASVQV